MKIIIKSKQCQYQCDDFDTSFSKFQIGDAQKMVRDFNIKNNLNLIYVKLTYTFDGRIIILCESPLSDDRDFKLKSVLLDD